VEPAGNSGVSNVVGAYIVTALVQFEEVSDGVTLDFDGSTCGIACEGNICGIAGGVYGFKCESGDLLLRKSLAGAGRREGRTESALLSNGDCSFPPRIWPTGTRRVLGEEGTLLV
jgi:hypothetical protein